MAEQRSAGQVIRRLLHILTLEEIEELTSSSMGVEKMSLTEMMEGKFEGIDLDPFSEQNRAKILTFEQAEEELEEEQALEMVSGSDLSPAIIKTQDTQAEVEHETGLSNDENGDPLHVEPPPPEEKMKESTSDFILSEKQRLKESQSKLKRKTVLQTYNKMAAVDIEQEKANKDNLKNSANSGVLVNKRQF